MRELVIVLADPILPPLAGEVVERSETEGGKITIPNAFLLPPTPCFAGYFPRKRGQIFIPTLTDPLPFSNAKTLLGQEFPYAIYDMRAENGVCLQLDALAIVAGTIQQGGKLYLLCPDWHSLPEQLDDDALRWNANTPISTPNFYRYFQQLVAEFGFKVQTNFGELPKKRDIATKKGFQFTDEQQHILHNLPLATADIHLITAPRGRGKSTLSGKLAEQLSQTYKVLITARSQSALPSFWQQISKEKIPFFAPDKLLQQIETQKHISQRRKRN